MIKVAVKLKPSLSIKIFSINNFSTKLLRELISDLYSLYRVPKKFGRKVINRQFFHSIVNFTKLLSIKD